MAKQGWFILTDDQFQILSAYNYGDAISDIGGYHCVSNWYDIRDSIIAVFDATWEDDIDGNEVDQDKYDIIEASVQYMYYSTESHTWFPS